MRVYHCLLILLVFSNSLFAQRIDQLSDTAQVKAFMRSVSKDYMNFSFTVPLKILPDIKLINRHRKTTNKLFEKVDIDGNGLTDLIVNGYEDDFKQPWSLAVMDMGSDSFLISNFNNYGDRFYATRIIQIEEKVAIETTAFRLKETKSKGRYRLKTFSDTVVFANGSFIERAPRGEFTMQQFRYLLNGALYGRNFAYDIQGDSITYYRQDTTSEDAALRYHVYKATLPAAIKIELTDLLQNINFPALPDKYVDESTCEATTTTTLIYDNRLKKRISDRGDQGTFGLHALYHKLWHLSPRITWQKVGIVDDWPLFSTEEWQ